MESKTELRQLLILQMMVSLAFFALVPGCLVPRPHSNPALRSSLERGFQDRTLDPIEGFWKGKEAIADYELAIFATDASENDGFSFAGRNVGGVIRGAFSYKLRNAYQVILRCKPSQVAHSYHGQGMMVKGIREFWIDVSLNLLDPTTLEMEYHYGGPVIGGSKKRLNLAGPESVLAARLKQVAPSAGVDKAILSSGSGFLITHSHVVTNYHVIDSAKEVRCVIDSEQYAGNVVARDPDNDLAIIELDRAVPDSFPVFRIGQASDLRLGQRVYAMGYPLTDVLGTGLHAHEGIVSSLSGFEGRSSQVQMEMSLNPGNSGGPLVDDRGALVGVVTSKLSLGYALSSGSIPEGITFAVRAGFVRLLCNSIQLKVKAGTEKASQVATELSTLVENLGEAVVRVEVER